MKVKGASVAIAVAAMAGGASARAHRHVHELFRREGAICQPSCTTIYATVTGEPTLHFPPVPVAPTTPVPVVAAPVEAAPVVSVPVVPVPTPGVHSCQTPGTYSFPATTVTLTEPTTVVGVTSAELDAGTHVIGGYTTDVSAPTTLTLPVAVVTETGGVVTSTISLTTHVCPSAGTYTVAPTTTVVPDHCTVTFPIPTSYESGVYTAPPVVTTVTVSSYVFYCPYTSSGLVSTSVLPTELPIPTPTEIPTLPPPETSAPSSSSHEAVPTTTSTTTPEPPVVSVSIPSAEPSYSSSSSSSYPSSSSTSEVPKPSSGPSPPSNHLGSDTDHYAMSYTPYEPDTGGKCKDAAAVEADVGLLAGAGFKALRVYSTDCSALENVGPACRKHGLHMILGVFIKEDGCSYDTATVRDQVDAIVEWAQWDLVDAIVIGNEAVHSQKCSASSLATLISTARGMLTGAGYSGPVTTAETTDVWLDSSMAAVLCPEVGVLGANAHPYFNPDTPASKAGEFVAGQLELMDGVCPGKSSVVLECGWPSAGVANGEAVPGVEEQAVAIQSIREAVGGRTTFFSMYPDKWKPKDTVCQCEQWWGCGHLFTDGLKA